MILLQLLSNNILYQASRSCIFYRGNCISLGVQEAETLMVPETIWRCRHDAWLDRLWIKKSNQPNKKHSSSKTGQNLRGNQNLMSFKLKMSLWNCFIPVVHHGSDFYFFFHCWTNSVFNCVTVFSLWVTQLFTVPPIWLKYLSD